MVALKSSSQLCATFSLKLKVLRLSCSDVPVIYNGTKSHSRLLVSYFLQKYYRTESSLLRHIGAERSWKVERFSVDPSIPINQWLLFCFQEELNMLFVTRWNSKRRIYSYSSRDPSDTHWLISFQSVNNGWKDMSKIAKTGKTAREFQTLGHSKVRTVMTTII